MHPDPGVTGIGWVLKGSRRLCRRSEKLSSGSVVVEGRSARGTHSHGTRDKQKRQVHGRQCEPTGVLAQLGGLGG